MVSYGTNSVDCSRSGPWEGNAKQVQMSHLALQSGVDMSIKYSEKQRWDFDDTTTKAGQCVAELQVGTNSVPASQA